KSPGTSPRASSMNSARSSSISGTSPSACARWESGDANRFARPAAADASGVIPPSDSGRAARQGRTEGPGIIRGRLTRGSGADIRGGFAVARGERACEGFDVAAGAEHDPVRLVDPMNRADQRARSLRFRVPGDDRPARLLEPEGKRLQ